MFIANQDAPAIQLRWNNSQGSELAGRTVQLRLYLRDAKIYGVTGNDD